MIDKIKDAIQNKNILKIYYEPGQRVIEPHTLGYSKKGDLLLSCYQVEGASTSHMHADWKLLRVDRMNILEPSGDPFSGPRPGYNSNDTRMKGGIIAGL